MTGAIDHAAFTTWLLDLDGDPVARAVVVGEAPATDTAGARCAGIAAAVVSGLAALLEGRRG